MNCTTPYAQELLFFPIEVQTVSFSGLFSLRSCTPQYFLVLTLSSTSCLNRVLLTCRRMADMVNCLASTLRIAVRLRVPPPSLHL